MSSGWYWRDGTLALPLRLDRGGPEWLATMRVIEEKLSDMSYKVVKQETLDTGYFISTVWLGLDHSFGRSGPPLIFETMVFSHDLSDGPSNSCDCERYSTEEEAREGHERMKAKWSYAAVRSETGVWTTPCFTWPDDEKKEE